MKSNSNIDELLCSFIDGELPPRQKTEVQRMAARDPQVSQRLRQLQNCKHLISVLTLTLCEVLKSCFNLVSFTRYVCKF